MKNQRVENGDFDYSGGQRTNNLPMVAGAVVLVIVIIVLCVLIWQMAHKENSSGGTSQTDHNMTEETQSFQREEAEASADIADDEQSDPAETEKADQEASETNPVQSEEITGTSEEGGTTAEPGQEDPESVKMYFEDVSETVTAKDVTNLRSEPDTSGDDTIVTQLKNGETALRTGVNENTGWSRVEYEGAILYAVSSLLTTDLTAKPDDTGSHNAADSNTVVTAAGRTITFTPCDDTVSPKMEVNLRSEPSTSQGNDTVHHRILYGENVHRTGYDTASGWSRVEYNGEVLYVVTSLIYVVEEPAEE